jgi:hypothetical protein
MKRRRVVRLLAIGAAGLAGCGGQDFDGEVSPPSPSATPSESETPTPRPEVYNLVIDARTIEFAESDDGTVLITIPVENTAEESQQAEMVVEVEAEGDRRTVSRRITVDAGATEPYTLELDTDWEQFRPNIRDVTFYEVESS